MRPIRWGILGTGSIAKAFAEALQETEGDLIAVASKTDARARKFCESYDCHAIEGYENLIKLDGIDAVYVATPHTDHFDLTAKCLKQKKSSSL